MNIDSSINYNSLTQNLSKHSDKAVSKSAIAEINVLQPLTTASFRTSDSIVSADDLQFTRKTLSTGKPSGLGLALTLSGKSVELQRNNGKYSSRHSESDQDAIKKLEKLDLNVRNHERAHSSIGGKYVGAFSYSTVKGPDGVTYVVDGEARINLKSVVGDPHATILKARLVQRAALAPENLSSVDRKTAMRAVQIA